MRPILSPWCSVNHNAPSGPAVIPRGSTLLKVGKGYSVIAPPVVIRPILLPAPMLPYSVNQSAPSGPAVIPWGEDWAVGSGNSVIVPAVVMRPILLALGSVNQRAPSGP